jgi:hypothetical protein
MTPYVSALLQELSLDLPVMARSMPGESFREAVMFRCSEILSLAPALDLEPVRGSIERLRAIYRW